MTNEIDAIDHDADAVAVAKLAERAAGQRFGADVADALAGRDTAEASIGQHGDVFAPGEIFKRRGDLVISSMPVPSGPTPAEHEHIARLYSARLDRGDRGSFHW